MMHSVISLLMRIFCPMFILWLLLKDKCFHLMAVHLCVKHNTDHVMRQSATVICSHLWELLTRTTNIINLKARP
jgi:hypothetical protein